MKEYDVTNEASNEDFLTNEFVRRIINETIEFDRKMRDPEFRKEIEIEKERMRNIDFSQYFKDEE